MVLKKKEALSKKKVAEFEPDIEIEEDTYGTGGYGKDKLSYKNIVLEQYKKCCEEGSREMTPAGIIRRNLVDGEVVEFVTVDQIQIFTNSVDMLKNLLETHIKAQKSFIGTRINNITIRERNNKEKKKKMIKKLDFWYSKTSIEVNPDGNSERELAHDFYTKRKDSIKRAYIEIKLRIYKDLLKVLGMLLSKLNYFDEVGGIGF